MSCNSLVDECVVSSLALLLQNQIIFRAVNDEFRRAVIATHDLVRSCLPKGTLISQFGACSHLFAVKTNNYDGQRLCLPVDV